MTDILITDSSGNTVGTITWDEINNQVVINSTEGINLIAANNGDIATTPSGSGTTVINGLHFPRVDGTFGQLLTTNGAGTLSFITLPDTVVSSLNDLSDVSFPNGQDQGWILTYSVADSSWIAVQPPDFDLVLTDLNDVTIVNPVESDVLSYNSLTQMWENVPPSSSTSTTLGDLQDVTLTNVQLNQGITWNGTFWVNTDLATGTGNVESVFGRTGIITAEAADYGAFYANLASGALADTSLQPGDNITELTNDANYITLAQVPADAVSNVFGRTGAVVAQSTDYSTFYATTAQGALADTATQSGDNVSELANDAGYITLAQVPVPPTPTATDVTYDNTVSGLTATDVQSALDEIDTAVDLNTAARHTHLNKSVLDSITAAGSGQIITIQERLHLSTSLQPGDNVSELANDAGYITAADIPPDAGVASFNSRSGVVVPLGTDYSTFYATTAQGALADTSVQPADNVSVLTNDAGYITLAQVPADAVLSFNTRTGAIVPLATDYASFYATTAQGALADTALQSFSDDPSPAASNTLAMGVHNVTFTPATGLDNLPGITSDEVTALNYMKFGTITEAESGIPGTGVGIHVLANMFYYGSANSSANVVNRDFGDRNYLRYTGAITTLNMSNWGIINAGEVGVGNNKVAKMLNSASVKPGTDGLIFVGDTFAISNDTGADVVYYPVSAGASTTGKVLTSDGLGNITFQTPASGGNVDSVFGRTGAVVATQGDYATYYAPIEATSYAIDTVQDLLDPSSVNIASGGFLTYTATGANTWNFTVPNTAGKAIGWTLELTNGGTGEQTFTGVTWAAGSAPTLVASGVNVLVFTKNNVTGVIRGYVAA